MWLEFIFATGSEFFVGFVPNFGVTSTLTLFTSGEELLNYSIEATVTGYYQNGSVTSYDQNTFILPISLTGPSRNIPNGFNDEHKEGIHICTPGDKLIVIGSLGSHNFDTFLAIPTYD